MIQQTAARRLFLGGVTGCLVLPLIGCPPDPGIPERPLSISVPPAADAPPSEGSASRGSGSERQSIWVVRADWDDIPAAISRVSTAAAVAAHSTTARGSGLRGSSYRVEFVAIDGQPAAAELTAQEDWSPAGPPAAIRIEVTFGKPNDPGRAAALGQQLARALESLAGRAFAPLGGP